MQRQRSGPFLKNCLDYFVLQFQVISHVCLPSSNEYVLFSRFSLYFFFFPACFTWRLFQVKVSFLLFFPAHLWWEMFPLNFLWGIEKTKTNVRPSHGIVQEQELTPVQTWHLKTASESRPFPRSCIFFFLLLCLGKHLLHVLKCISLLCIAHDREGKIVWRLLWPSFTPFFFPCPGLVYQAPVFKLNITPVLLRKLWWFNHCQWSYASRVWLARQKGPSAVVRPAAKGLILWSKNCRLLHMFPINVECSVGLEEAFIMKWPSLHQTPW